MILKLALLQEPSSDLGYLLHKNPSRLHEAEFSFGRGFVAFREDESKQTECALILEIDSVGLVRGGATYDQYVNDRPYSANSFLSSSITEFFSTAMSGRSKERQELADSDLPLRFELPVLRSRGGEPTIRAMFEPLGYKLEIEAVGNRYFKVVGTYQGKIRDLLTQLYILIPVLDDDKHYYVDRNEIDKLFGRAERWLPTHPLRELITRRYLRYDKILTREAVERLTEFDVIEDQDETESVTPNQQENEEPTPKKLSVHDLRLEKVSETLLSLGVSTVADLGCGEGKLIKILARERQFKKILGMDVCLRSLDYAERRLNLKEASQQKRDRIKLIHGSLMYRDERISGFEAAALVEVIEHMDLPRLAHFEQVLFAYARPGYAIITTPNKEYNAVFENEQETMRHDDHRFEWTREEFKSWCESIQSRFGYTFEISGIGDPHPDFGSLTQMAVFRK